MIDFKGISAAAGIAMAFVLGICAVHEIGSWVILFIPTKVLFEGGAFFFLTALIYTIRKMR